MAKEQLYEFEVELKYRAVLAVRHAVNDESGASEKAEACAKASQHLWEEINTDCSLLDVENVEEEEDDGEEDETT